MSNIRGSMANHLTFWGEQWTISTASWLLKCSHSPSDANITNWYFAHSLCSSMDGSGQRIGLWNALRIRKQARRDSQLNSELFSLVWPIILETWIMPFMRQKLCFRATIWGSFGCTCLSSSLTAWKLVLCSDDSWTTLMSLMPLSTLPGDNTWITGVCYVEDRFVDMYRNHQITRTDQGNLRFDEPLISHMIQKTLLHGSVGSVEDVKPRQSVVPSQTNYSAARSSCKGSGAQVDAKA